MLLKIEEIELIVLVANANSLVVAKISFYAIILELHVQCASRFLNSKEFLC